MKYILLCLLPLTGYSMSLTEIIKVQYMQQPTIGVILRQTTDKDGHEHYGLGTFSGEKSQENNNLTKSEFEYQKKFLDTIDHQYKKRNSQECKHAIKVQRSSELYCLIDNEKKYALFLEWHQQVEQIVSSKKERDQHLLKKFLSPKK